MRNNRKDAKEGCRLNDCWCWSFPGAVDFDKPELGMRGETQTSNIQDKHGWISTETLKTAGWLHAFGLMVCVT
jgi:hypothetical protein